MSKPTNEEILRAIEDLYNSTVDEGDHGTADTEEENGTYDVVIVNDDDVPVWTHAGDTENERTACVLALSQMCVDFLDAELTDTLEHPDALPRALEVLIRCLAATRQMPPA